MKVEWNEKMRRMDEEGNLKKDVDNNHIEGVRYKDLEYLKERGGPFTTAKEVKEFDLNNDESQDKNIRLYTGVRYAKNSCLSLKHTASVFRLKRDYKNLQSNEYIENLCQYLGDATNKTVLTSDDPSLSVLDSLITNHENQVPPQTSDETNMPTDEQQTTDTVKYSLNEHIATVWVDEKDNELSWFLGVVNSVSAETIDVTYYH